MVNIRNCQVSSQYFWGFQHQVDLDEVNSLEEITEKVISKMRQVLKENNFIVLLETLDGRNGIPGMHFHIHQKTFEEVLLAPTEDIVYVCCH